MSTGAVKQSLQNNQNQNQIKLITRRVSQANQRRISIYADRSFPYTAVNSSVFKRRLKVDSDSDDLQLNDKLFLTDGALTLKACIANDNFIKG